jgi:hypothetical protein
MAPMNTKWGPLLFGAGIALALLIIAILSRPHWPAWGYSAEVAAALVAAALGGVIAVWAIYSQRAITRRQVTLEMLSENESEGTRTGNRQKYRQLARDPQILQTYAQADKEDTEEYQVVVRRLNEYELISIGIQRGIIDFEIYKLWWKSGTVRAWRDCKPFIETLRHRQRNDKLFYEFEMMVGWFEHDSRPARSRWWGVFF